jgi:hypothetical protein
MKHAVSTYIQRNTRSWLHGPCNKTKHHSQTCMQNKLPCLDPRLKSQSGQADFKKDLHDVSILIMIENGRWYHQRMPGCHL